MKFRIVKNFRFDAAHTLVGDQGKCGTLHGHTWSGEVICEGTDGLLDKGILVDFREIKNVVSQFDHCDLNRKLVEMGYPPSIAERPTAEHIARILLEKIPLAVKVVLFESPDNKVEVSY